MSQLKQGSRVRVRISPNDVSKEVYAVANPDIKGLGRLAEIKDPARLVLLVDTPSYLTNHLAKYEDCVVID